MIKGVGYTKPVLYWVVDQAPRSHQTLNETQKEPTDAAPRQEMAVDVNVLTMGEQMVDGLFLLVTKRHLS